MKVSLNSRTVFFFPTGCIVNRFTAGLIRRRLKKEGVRLTKGQTVRLIKALRQYKADHAEWNLVEVACKSGDTVTVKI